MQDQAPIDDPVEERPLPPEQLPGASAAPTPFADLPKPARRGDSTIAVPFDPLGYHVFSTLAEVDKKPERSDEVLTKAQVDAARRKSSFVAKFSTLEGMYAQHPELMRVGKLRIERIQPQWADDAYGQKVRVCGTLDFKHPCIDSATFTRTFGGFKYRVFGLVEQENRENQGGPPQLVEIAVAEFEVPIPPNLNNLPVAIGEEAADAVPPPFPFAFAPTGTPYGRRPGMPNMPQYPFFSAPAPNQPGVPIEPILNFAGRMVEQRQPAQPPITDAVWNVLSRNSEQATEAIRQASESNMRMLQSQYETQQRQLEHAQAKLEAAQNRPTDMVQMVESVAKLTQAQKGGADSEVIRQMRDDHERQIAKLNDHYERTIARMESEAERREKEQKDGYERILLREREAAEMKLRIAEQRNGELQLKSEARERELKDELERRERSVRDEMQRIMDSRDRDHAARMAEIKDLHAREVMAMKDMHDRELRLHETLQSNTTQVSGKAHEIEMRALQTELAKLTGELAEKRALVEQHMQEKNKPLLEQVRELQETTSALQEIAGGPETSDAPEAKKPWYESELVQAVAPILIQKGAELLPKPKDGAAQSMAGAPSGMPMMPPGQLPGRPQPRAALPPKRRQRIVFSDTDAPPLRETPEVVPVRRPIQQNITQGGAAPRQFVVEPGPSPVPPGPVEPLPPPAAVQQRPVQSARAQQVNAAATAQSAADGWEAFAWVPMPKSDTVAFIGQLEGAYTSKVDALQLVEAFVGTYPMQVIQQIPNVLPVERLIESIRTSPATQGMGIATGGGRRYLTQVWAKLEEKIATWQNAQHPAAPSAPAEKQPEAVAKPEEVQP